jgi:hypothetical protein
MDRELIESIASQVIIFISEHGAKDSNQVFESEEIAAQVEFYLSNPMLKALKISEEVKSLIINKVLMQMSSSVGSKSIVLENPQVERWLDDARADIEWNYWKHYKDLLIRKGRDRGSLLETEKVIDEILDLSGDPKKYDAFKRKGLVMGNVQSGKTESYLGLINKAIDTGYKIIILLGGHQNGLRKQTQLRVDEGVIGTKTKGLGLDHNKRIGVGITRPKNYRVVSFTSSDRDFNSNALDVLDRVVLGDIDGPVVLTVKKWHTVLESLYKWLKKTNALDPEKNILLDFPLLFIDDEADYATPNSKAPERADIAQVTVSNQALSKDDEDDEEEEDKVTATNGNIRRILSLFRKSTYVAYTASPFANIFIHPDAAEEKFRDQVLNDDLYPSDFMIKLHRPDAYLGQDFFFNPNTVNDKENLSKDNEKPVVRISDHERLIPMDHSKNVEVGNLPPSLTEAIRAFFISCAVRSLRGEKKEHMTMMINVSRFNIIQEKVTTKVGLYVEKLKNHIDVCHNLPSIERDENPVFRDLKETYQERFDLPESFDEIVSQLKGTEKIKILQTNVTTGEGLNYEEYEENGLWTIVIGGLKLSRGLTLEGLNITYFARNSKGVDTLMQMCRWFGYKKGYENLCKVYLPQESISWYTHITEVVNDLYHQLKIMREAGKTPDEFGLKVRDHPGTLMITAANKRKNAFERNVYMDMWGQTIRRMRLDSSTEINSSNLEQTTQFIQSLMGDSSEQRIEEKSQSLLFDEVGHEKVVDYIKKLELKPDIHPDELLFSYIEKMMGSDMPKFKVCVFNNKEPGSTAWTNGDITPENGKIALKTFTFCGHHFNLRLRTLTKDGNGFKTASSNLGDPKDESYYLEPETTKKILDAYDNPSPFHFIKAQERDFPTLNIYLLSIGVKPSGDKVIKENRKISIPFEKVPSVVISISFPLLDNQKNETLESIKNQNKKTLESFVVTKRFIEQYQKELAGF